jgi:aryl-alcohol dehydrogenase
MAPTTTQAYVARLGDGGGVKLENITYDSPAAHEALVDVVAFSICHTDIRTAEGNFHVKPPIVLGHEATAIVREIGPEVDYVKEGDKVVLAYASCGRCRRCLMGRQPYCEEVAGMNFGGRREGKEGEFVARDEKGEGVEALFFGHSSMGRVALVREEVSIPFHEMDLGTFVLKKCSFVR